MSKAEMQKLRNKLIVLRSMTSVFTQHEINAMNMVIDAIESVSHYPEA